jgi:hypothetical protein
MKGIKKREEKQDMKEYRIKEGMQKRKQNMKQEENTRKKL